MIELPDPTPGPRQVLVENRAVGINFVETLIRRGRIPPALAHSFPLVPGQEGSGVVQAVGEGVEGLKVGTRVMWMDDPFEAHGYAELSLVRASNVVPIADNVSFELAACTPVTYGTAHNQLYNLYGRAERQGRWALIRNAAGGAGTALLETAKGAGMRTIAVVTSAKLEYARAHGADAVIEDKSGKSRGAGSRDYGRRWRRVGPEPAWRRYPAGGCPDVGPNGTFDSVWTYHRHAHGRYLGAH